jgi:hypothetical protein
MNKEFILYEQALALKELGFDEPCLGLFHNDKSFYPTQCKSHEQYHGQVCSVPLYQQAFRWFREKHNFKHCIIPLVCEQGFSDLYESRIHQEKHSISIIGNYKIYKEAELACLKKLIEIVKNK